MVLGIEQRSSGAIVRNGCVPVTAAYGAGGVVGVSRLVIDSLRQAETQMQECPVSSFNGPLASRFQRRKRPAFVIRVLGNGARESAACPLDAAVRKTKGKVGPMQAKAVRRLCRKKCPGGPASG